MVNVDGPALEALVSFCYTGKIKINDVNVVSILPAACLLQLHEVQEMCCNFLKKKLNSSNCLGIRAFADTYSCRELRCCADKYILHNFQDVIGNEDFILLPVNQLLKLFSSDELRAKSEEDVSIQRNALFSDAYCFSKV
ncbi:hypothetical protein GCK32_020053 [Trichostrongylus colubriformis]|uniref:BACK domain-containing protein n=1 Tax=Trichostrongylus colubriformis TaxID=6319 RepID=A0AAN8FDW5_TRICO